MFVWGLVARKGSLFYSSIHPRAALLGPWTTAFSCPSRDHHLGDLSKSGAPTPTPNPKDGSQSGEHTGNQNQNL